MTIEDAINLALQHHQSGRLAEAEQLYRQILGVDPNHADALNRLGVLASQMRRHDVACLLLTRAIGSDPTKPEYHQNLGVALAETGRLEEGVAATRRALAINPELVEAWSNLGNAWRETGEVTEAISACRKAIALRGDCAEGHSNLGLALLLRGDFEEGWEEYEWRGRNPQYVNTNKNIFAPTWNGEELSGHRILLQAEQGMGDVIQFVRYIPQVIRRGGRIALACQGDLHRLLKRTGWIEQWATFDEPSPEHDLRCLLLSLPRIFGTRLQTIPAAVPYLSAEPALSERWRARMSDGGASGRLKVGLAWAGRPVHPNDRNRSFPLATFAPLAEVPEIRFFSLQKGPAAEQVRSFPVQITDWTEELRDFADTAALVDNLDLIITADTAVAHLAGAMGKAVWVLLPFAPDWRWMLDRSDSPWYPTMRLFRQPRRGDWRTPVEQVREKIMNYEL